MAKIEKYKFGENTVYYLMQFIFNTLVIGYLLLTMNYITKMQNGYLILLWFATSALVMIFWFINLSSFADSFDVYEIDARKIK